MWNFLFTAFRVASSPSRRIIPYNILDDDAIKRPLSEQKQCKVLPLSIDEENALNEVLDIKERNHKYRNIVKLMLLTGMRIGETLARSKYDIVEDFTKLRINNTLTEDVNGNIVIGEHTKTYNKQTGVDNGARFFPITSEIREILNEQLTDNITNIHGLIFWDYEDHRLITQKEVNAWLRRINVKYKISNTNLFNHRIRHTTITRWKEKRG